MRTATVGICVLLALLELAHPVWAGSDVSAGISAAGSLWVPLHVALLLAYAALCTLLWMSTPSRLARAALFAFGLANTAFLSIDGLVVGLRATTDPGAADAVWSSTTVQLLADVVGALWCIALFVLGASLADRLTHVLLVLAWLAFVASATALSVTPLVSRALTLAAGAWLVYRSGTSMLPAALLFFAGVLRQHAGPEAALGMVCIAIAIAMRRRVREPRAE